MKASILDAGGPVRRLLRCPRTAEARTQAMSVEMRGWRQWQGQQAPPGNEKSETVSRKSSNGRGHRASRRDSHAAGQAGSIRQP